LEKFTPLDYGIKDRLFNTMHRGIALQLPGILIVKNNALNGK
jgi:hypothetical protein